MAETGSERRRHSRIPFEHAIYIEVVKRGSLRESDNTVIRCETIDVSIGGLRAWVPEPVPEGSHLNIAAYIGGSEGNLELQGECKWLGPAEGREGYWVGLELNDGTRENMDKWFRVVTRLQASGKER